MGKFRAHQEKGRAGAGTKKQQPSEPSGGGGGADKEKGINAGKAGADKPKKVKVVTYDKDHSVLICGDGDFSFTRGMIEHRKTGAGLVSTSLDSRTEVLKKYPRAKTWLPKLEQDGAKVIHSVDATRLEETLSEKIPFVDGSDGEGGKKPRRRVMFDRVVFNFPHTGKQRTHLNQNLIRDFFASTKNLVKCAPAGGEVHVTLKDKPPYNGWNIKGMAKESDMVMVKTLSFDPTLFPGYQHSTTDPKANEFNAAGARTFVFGRAKSEIDDEVDEAGVISVPKEDKNGVNGMDEVSDGNDDDDAKDGGPKRSVINADDSPLEEDALVSEDEGADDGKTSPAKGGVSGLKKGDDCATLGDTPNGTKKRSRGEEATVSISGKHARRGSRGKRRGAAAERPSGKPQEQTLSGRDPDGDSALQEPEEQKQGQPQQEQEQHQDEETPEQKQPVTRKKLRRCARRKSKAQDGKAKGGSEAATDPLPGGTEGESVGPSEEAAAPAVERKQNTGSQGGVSKRKRKGASGAAPPRAQVESEDARKHEDSGKENAPTLNGTSKKAGGEGDGPSKETGSEREPGDDAAAKKKRRKKPNLAGGKAGAAGTTDKKTGDS